MKELLDAYKERVLLKRQKEQELKDINEDIKSLEYEVLAKFEEIGLQNIKLDTGETVALRTDIRASILAEDRDSVYSEFKKHGFDGLVKEVIHPKTLESWAREYRTLNGVELPEWAEGLVQVYEQIRPTILNLKA